MRAPVALRWPLGVAFTAWSYLWRTTPIHRRQVEGEWSRDAPPDVLDPDASLEGVQRVEDGCGAYLRRRYRIVLRDATLPAAEVMRAVKADPNRVAPGSLAHFRKERGAEGELRVGDEFVVRMPGPWDGPVRVIDVTPTSFRMATLGGHIEAGHIEWRARDEDGRLAFEVESWSRPGDKASDLMHHRLGMAKEVQLHMWTSVLERVEREFGGRRDEPLDIETRVVVID
jgi:hypothetical protein